MYIQDSPMQYPQLITSLARSGGNQIPEWYKIWKKELAMRRVQVDKSRRPLSTAASLVLCHPWVCKNLFISAPQKE